MNEGTLKKSGYQLVGWKDESGKVYKPGDKFATGDVKTDTVLTAVWEKIPLSKTAKANNKPNTGDTNSQVIYIAIMISAAALILASYKCSKK